jgi:aldose sugar dehydrogenase
MKHRVMKHHYLLFFLLIIVFVLPVLVSYVSNSKSKNTTETKAQTAPTMTVIAKNLEIPWALDFLPDGDIIFTERPGRVKTIDSATGTIKQVGTIPDVRTGAESGLLGIVRHPQFVTNSYIYVYYSYDNGGAINNKVVRYKLVNNLLTEPQTIIEGIPGGDYHNGGRMRFGPDGYLYITTGDGNNTANPQNTASLGGKILRVKDDGTAAPGNPFNNRTYTYGHRNPQGITWNGNVMYETEHGPSGTESCCDEVNRIEIGKNYGWPDVRGSETKDGTMLNLLNSGPSANDTWAPSGTAFYNGHIFFGGLKGEALYEVQPEGDSATIVATHFKHELGRIREVIVGPDNQLYITTSNKSTQGGTQQAEDDKIIKLSFGNAVVSPTLTTPPSVDPTYTCLGGTNCAPSISPSTTGIAEPSTTVTEPSTTVTEPTTGTEEPTSGVEEPTITVCPTQETEGLVNVQHKGRGGGGHGDGKGMFSWLIELLIKLINILLGRMGGTPIDVPGNGC